MVSEFSFYTIAILLFKLLSVEDVICENSFIHQYGYWSTGID